MAQLLLHFQIDAAKVLISPSPKSTRVARLATLVYQLCRFPCAFLLACLAFISSSSIHFAPPRPSLSLLPSIPFAAPSGAAHLTKVAPAPPLAPTPASIQPDLLPLCHLLALQLPSSSFIYLAGRLPVSSAPAPFTPASASCAALPRLLVSSPSRLPATAIHGPSNNVFWT